MLRPTFDLHIRNVRLEAPPPNADRPSALLRFDMLNNSTVRMTDVSIEIAIVEKWQSPDQSRMPRVIVGPFTIRGDATIEAGYTLNYQMLLRNLSSDCGCQANITVVSARPLDGPRK